jgi:hypothetical protein
VTKPGWLGIATACIYLAALTSGDVKACGGDYDRLIEWDTMADLVVYAWMDYARVTKSGDGALAVVGGEDARFELRRISTGATLKTIDCHASYPALSAEDNRRIRSCNWEQVRSLAPFDQVGANHRGADVRERISITPGALSFVAPEGARATLLDLQAGPVTMLRATMDSESIYVGLLSVETECPNHSEVLVKLPRPDISRPVRERQRNLVSQALQLADRAQLDSGVSCMKKARQGGVLSVADVVALFCDEPRPAGRPRYTWRTMSASLPAPEARMLTKALDRRGCLTSR